MTSIQTGIQTNDRLVMIRAAKDYLRNHPDWPLRIVFTLPDAKVYDVSPGQGVTGP